MRTPQLLALEVVLAGDDRAHRAWERLGALIDLDHLAAYGPDLVPALGWRLADLGIRHPVAPRLVGAWRRAWADNQIRLAAIATGSGPSRLTGRPATLVAYAPSPGLLPWRVPGRRRVDAGMEATAGDRPVLVPDPPHHARAMLRAGALVDAALAMSHPAMDWDAFLRLRVGGPAARAALQTVASVTDVVPAEVLRDRRARPGLRSRRI